MLNRRFLWYLDSFTAWLFQWTLISELTIVTCFWTWLWVFDTDMSKLSGEQLRDKLGFDLFNNTENYNCSVPLVLLLCEYAINNIPFTWLHWFSILVLQFSYVLFQWFYCVHVTHMPVYN